MIVIKYSWLSQHFCFWCGVQCFSCILQVFRWDSGLVRVTLWSLIYLNEWLVLNRKADCDCAICFCPWWVFWSHLYKLSHITPAFRWTECNQCAVTHLKKGLQPFDEGSSKVVWTDLLHMVKPQMKIKILSHILGAKQTLEDTLFTWHSRIW